MCVVEVQTTPAAGSVAASRTSGVREIDRQLYLAVKALSPTDPLGEIQTLLNGGARPSRAGSKKGFTAADVAGHLGYPELLALFASLPAAAPDDEADVTVPDSASPTPGAGETTITALSETIPVAVGAEGTVTFPDRLLLPIVAPQASVVKIELWNIRPAPAAAAAVATATALPDGGSVRRTFMRAAQAPGAATLFEGECESMGSVYVPLAEVAVGKDLSFSLSPEGVADSASAPRVGRVDFQLVIFSDLSATNQPTCAEHRKLHRSLVRKVHVAASPSEPCDGDLRTAYDGGKTAAFRPLFDLYS